MITNLNSHSVIKIINQLKKYNIIFKGLDDKKWNVVMENEQMGKYKIATNIFFRYGGKCIYVKNGNKKNEIQILPLNNELFYNEILASIIIHYKIDKF